MSFERNGAEPLPQKHGPVGIKLCKENRQKQQAFQHEDSRQSNDELYMLGFVMKYQHPENRAGATTEQRQREQRPFRDTPGALSGHFLVCPEHRERDDAHKRRAQK